MRMMITGACLLALTLCVSLTHGGQEEAAEKPRPAEGAEPGQKAEEAPADKNAAEKKAKEARAKAAAEKKEKARQAAVEAQAKQIIRLQNGMQVQVGQFRKQIRQLFQIELAYVKRVCEITPEQRDALAQGALASIDRVMKSYQKPNNARGRQMIVGGFVGNGVMAVDDRGRELTLEEVKKLVREHLRHEQAKQYSEEVTQREDKLRESTARFLISHIDATIPLSKEQRVLLLEKLLDEWRSQYANLVTSLQSNPQYMPSVSNKTMYAVLNTRQKEIWQKLPKLGGGSFFHNGQQAVVDDFELPPDEEGKEKPDEQKENAGIQQIIINGLEAIQFGE